MRSIKFFFIIFFTAFHICASSSRDEQEGIGTNPDEIRSAMRETIAFMGGRAIAIKAASDFFGEGKQKLAEAAYGERLNHGMLGDLAEHASNWLNNVTVVDSHFHEYNSFQRLTEDKKRSIAPRLFAQKISRFLYSHAFKYHKIHTIGGRFSAYNPQVILLESLLMNTDVKLLREVEYYTELPHFLLLRTFYAYMSPRDCKKSLLVLLGTHVNLSGQRPSRTESLGFFSAKNAMRASLNEHLAANKAFSDYMQGKTNRIPSPCEFTIIGKDESGRALPHLQITPELEAAALWRYGTHRIASDRLNGPPSQQHLPEPKIEAWDTVMVDWVFASKKRKKVFEGVLATIEKINGPYLEGELLVQESINASLQARRPSKEAVARARRILRGEPADVGSGVGAGGGSKPEAAAASPSKTKGRRKKGSNKKRSAAPQRPEIAVARAPLASAEPSVAAQNQAKLLEEEARLQKERDAADAENERQWGIIHAVNQALSHRRQVLRSGDSSASAPQAASQAVSVDDRAEAASVSPGVFRSQELPVARVLLSNLGANNGLRRFADLLNTPGGSMINGFAIRQGLEALQRIFPDSFVLGEMEGSRVRVRHPNLPYPLTLHLHSGMISQDARSTRSAYRVLLDHLVVDDIDGELAATGSGGGE
ncbi:MAG: hypothetical protein H6849_01825 [Alphaproteobacteria bacterium]|nr:MAG: hypothetical protein H6849_01825 [Alphaproteobacteria bacterium]